MKHSLTRLLSLLLCLLCVTTLIACKEKEADDEETKEKEQEAVSLDLSITVGGTKIALGTDAEPLLTALGTPVAQSSIGNCGGKEGTWTRYTYAGFYLLVLENGSSQTVDQIELRDDSVLTAKGVGIGSAKADVTKAYGNGYDRAQSSDAALVYKQGNKQLEFHLENDTVVGVIFACK